MHEIPSIFGILFQFLLLAIESLITYAEGSYRRSKANAAYETVCLLARIVHNSRRGEKLLCLTYVSVSIRKNAYGACSSVGPFQVC